MKDNRVNSIDLNLHNEFLRCEQLAMPILNDIQPSLKDINDFETLSNVTLTAAVIGPTASLWATSSICAMLAQSAFGGEWQSLGFLSSLWLASGSVLAGNIILKHPKLASVKDKITKKFQYFRDAKEKSKQAYEHCYAILTNKDNHFLILHLFEQALIIDKYHSKFSQSSDEERYNRNLKRYQHFTHCLANNEYSDIVNQFSTLYSHYCYMKSLHVGNQAVDDPNLNKNAYMNQYNTYKNLLKKSYKEVVKNDNNEKEMEINGSIIDKKVSGESIQDRIKKQL